jgi:hypothetical protein
MLKSVPSSAHVYSKMLIDELVVLLWRLRGPKKLGKTWYV